MTSKEDKAVLKGIRDAIKAEKYPLAIKKCQGILDRDPDNYMGNLLMGAAYQKSDKGKAAYYLHKALAVSSKPPPIVVLQGLANCAAMDELPEIYSQLIDLMPEKQKDYLEKIFNISHNTTLANVCFNILKDKYYKRQGDEMTKISILKYLGRIWIKHNFSYDFVKDDDQLYKLALEAILSDASNEDFLIAYKHYVRLLFNSNEQIAVLQHSNKLIDLYPNDSYAYEWICKIYCESYDSERCSTFLLNLKKPIDYYADKLCELKSNVSTALTIKAISNFQSEQFVAARNELYKVLQIHNNYLIAMKLLAMIEMKLEAYERALPLWQQLGEDYLQQYALCLSYALDQCQLQEAIKILNNCDRNPEITKALARCYSELDQKNELYHICEGNFALTAEYLKEPLDALNYLNTYATNDNISIMETYPILKLFGELYYKIGNYSMALLYSLKATRLQPNSSQCFWQLAQIYSAQTDIIRARKCYEKCLLLNPLNIQAIENLSAIYQKLNEKQSNETLLLNSIKYSDNLQISKRIQYQLGLHYFDTKSWNEAIHSLRTAIQYDAGCLTYWETLGDAYFERGSYNSAIRVFQKILQIQPDNLYAKLQTALMKSTTRMYAEAVDDFDALLNENFDYLPALKGAAEAHIGLAKSLKTEHRYRRCRQHLQLALNFLQRCFLNTENLNMVWPWRLTANVFLLTAKMPESLANLDVDGKLVRYDGEITFLRRHELLNLSIRFLTCALKIKENTHLWYELALCCYNKALYVHEEAASCLDMATKACQMAIKAKSNLWINWNLLGVIKMHKAIDNLPLAQHCFIKALKLEHRSYTTWTNLGVLYLKLNEIRLANQVFQRAQQSSPIYGNAWIGQAMIAETIAEEVEALDLYRHCQQFGYHCEAALGYAHWTCRILSDPQKRQSPHHKYILNNMYADVVALDAINCYVVNEEETDQASAYSFQGFLCERQKLYKCAAAAYLKAATAADSASERDMMYCNLGYVHLKMDDYYAAINAFNKVSQASFKPLIGLALAYFRCGQHQEAYTIYNSILKNVAGIEDVKSAQILIAMASMVYTFQGEGDTKTILYQCILLKDSPIQALYSACALGILHADNQLTETILTELKKHERCADFVTDIAYLMAQYFLSTKRNSTALNYIMSCIYTFPHMAGLRKLFANFLLDNCSHQREYHVAASRIALSAIALMHSNGVNKIDCVEHSETLLTASRALQRTDEKKSIKLIQRALHLYPKNSKAWKILLQAY